MTPYQLTSYQCYEAPAVVVLFYHNVYEEGKQGGFEIIQRGRRIAGNGNLRLGPAPEQWDPLPGNGERRLLPDGSLQVTCEYASPGLRYTVHLKPEGEALHLSVSLEKPLPPELRGHVSFNLELIPDQFMGKSYFLDERAGIFPRQFDSGWIAGPEGDLIPQVLASGHRLIVTPEDPATRLEIESLRGELALLDGRATAENGWFVVRDLVPTGVSENVIEWRITPTITPGWVRPPVIGYSQVGYHPRQKKVAAIELDPTVTRPSSARLVRLAAHGSSLLVKESRLDLWGSYLNFNYALFDFSDVSEPGLYRLEYEGQSTSPFPIAADIYQRGVWQPTLETFLPVQMCHVEVRDAYRVWHGLCHMDDALQAPLDHEHFDSYVQYSETETPFAPLTHIPHLNVGGWHDAGDYDLAAGSQANTTHILTLVRETFGLNSDQTTVDQAKRRAILHQPDGIPDVVQQVAHGVENLLSGYRATAGQPDSHSFSGIIESNLKQYVHLGDAATMTDNRVTPGPVDVSDDRWAFTNRDTALEYRVAAALAAAARVLRGWEDALADECLQTARRVWEYEQSHAVKVARSCYVPDRADLQEVLAAVELWITTGEETFRQRLLALQSLILEHVPLVGWAVARVIFRLGDASFEAQFRRKVAEFGQHLAADAARNPFGVPYTAESWRQQAPIWGIAWSLQQRAVSAYFLHRAYPALVDANLIFSTVGYVLGCHPVSNVSLVSGVGPQSLTIAYGVNRAEWSYTPGGVVSGPAFIRPNYVELQDPFPFLWQQKEYVIGGAATYIFCVLASDQLLNQYPS